jgi:hypothetical protein
VIVDADYLPGLEIDDGVEPLDRMRVEVLVLAKPEPCEDVAHMTTFLVLETEIAARPGIDAHFAHVCDAALRAGSHELWILPDKLFDRHELLKLHHGALIGIFLT